MDPVGPSSPTRAGDTTRASVAPTVLTATAAAGSGASSVGSQGLQHVHEGQGRKGHGGRAQQACRDAIQHRLGHCQVLGRDDRHQFGPRSAGKIDDGAVATPVGLEQCVLAPVIRRRAAFDKARAFQSVDLALEGGRCDVQGGGMAIGKLKVVSKLMIWAGDIRACPIEYVSPRAAPPRLVHNFWGSFRG